jgi:hypothetical protein
MLERLNCFIHYIYWTIVAAITKKDCDKMMKGFWGDPRTPTVMECGARKSMVLKIMKYHIPSRGTCIYCGAPGHAVHGKVCRECARDISFLETEEDWL